MRAQTLTEQRRDERLQEWLPLLCGEDGSGGLVRQKMPCDVQQSCDLARARLVRQRGKGWLEWNTLGQFY
jgi:hypothetical protein